MRAPHGSTTVTAVVVDATGRRAAVVSLALPQRFWLPEVEAVLQTLNEVHGIDAIALVCLEFDRLGDDVTAEWLVELRPGAVLPAGVHWSDDVPARAADHLARPVDHPVTPPWTRLGWYAEALDWILTRAAAADRPLTGDPVQLRTWGLATVFRCPTADGPLFFKAAAHASILRGVERDLGPEPLLFAHEPRLLRELAAYGPADGVPEPLATDDERVWLLLSDGGELLDGVEDLEPWAETLRQHARRQRGYVGHTERLVAAGCVDRGLTALDDAIDRLLGPNRITAALEPEIRTRAAALGPTLHALVADLARIGVPETLLHSDLHPRNVLVADSRPTVIDWTDACVAHPFLDLVTFFEINSAATEEPGVRDGLRDAYLGEWAGLPDLDVDDLRTALALAERVAPLHQAVTYLHLVDSVDGTTSPGMLRGGTTWLTALVEAESSQP